MTSLLVFLLLGQQGPTAARTTIWQEISDVESLVTEIVKADASLYTISSQNPVRGYYVARRGVILLVPMRYRRLQGPRVVPSRPEPGNTLVDSSQLKAKEIQKQLAKWREQLTQQRILKEANFEKVVRNLTAAIPGMVRFLRLLPGEEALTVIVEERVPSWTYPGFSLDRNPTTKVVTLTIDNKSAIAKVYAGKTELRGNWEAKVKRTNSYRDIVSLIP